MDIKERMIKKFSRAFANLEKAILLESVPDDVKRDVTLLRFELVAELMPKVLKRALEDRGASPALPKDIVRAAVAGELVSEDIALVLLAIIDDRNRMVHDYSESYATALYDRVVKEYHGALKEFARWLKSM